MPTHDQYQDQQQHGDAAAPVPGHGEGGMMGGGVPPVPPQMQVQQPYQYPAHPPPPPQFYGQQGGAAPQYPQQGAMPQYQPQTQQQYPPPLEGQMTVHQQPIQPNGYVPQPQYLQPTYGDDHPHHCAPVPMLPPPPDGAGYQPPVEEEPPQQQQQQQPPPQPPAAPSPQEQEAPVVTRTMRSPRKSLSPHEAWEARFAELTEFHAEFGHSDVPQTYKKNRALGKWVGKQREHYKTLQESGQSPLSEDRINKLTTLGFKFQMGKGQHAKIHGLFMTDSLIENWEQRFKDLEAFKEEHGHCDVPVKYPPNKALGRWVAMQRKKHRSVEKKEINTSASLLEDRMQRLRDLGFKFQIGRGDYVRGDHASSSRSSGGGFTSHDAIWEERRLALEAYKAEHGNCDVPLGYKADPKLAAWVAKQRELWRNKRDNRGGRKLTDERIAKLDDLGFHFQAYEASWEAKLAELREYKAKYGNVNVRDAYSRPLWHWSKRQRDAFKDFLDGKPGPMTHDRIRQLEELGFDWKYFDTAAKTESKTKKSMKGSSKAKDALIAASSRAGASSGSVTMDQGQAAASGNVKGTPAEVANAGEAVGLQSVGGAANAAVNMALAHVDPTAMPNLGGIMGSSNEGQSDQKLTGNDTMRKGTKPEKWLRNYEELVAYKNRHGDTRVPCRSKEYPKLGSWVKLQREDYRKMKLKKVTPMCQWRLDLLEKIGFEWRLAPSNGPTPWEERFEELKEYKSIFGNCNVPQAWPKNVPLGKWVSKQRDFYRFLKEGKPTRLDEDKIRQMESIGFQWFVGKGRGLRTWIDYYNDCVAFKAKYGHTNIPLRYEDSPALGTWANQQRINYNKVRAGKVHKKEVIEHNRMLEEIGFNFHSPDDGDTPNEMDKKSKKSKEDGKDSGKPKKRGRPSANRDESSEQETRVDAEERPKKRGRPRKTAKEPPKVGGETTSKESKDDTEPDSAGGESLKTAEV